MRFGHLLLVGGSALLAVSCDATAASTANQVPSSRRLRTEVKKLPASYIQGLMHNDDQLKTALNAWKQGKVTTKGLAESLDLSQNKIKWIRRIRNRKKIDEEILLQMFRARMGQSP
nr:Avh448 [Phytophthora sojae]AEK81351.1 Avh448 [Phytophthora sojae]AEK81352.1 Avh448 [Phytophthora sojae]